MGAQNTRRSSETADAIDILRAINVAQAAAAATITLPVPPAGTPGDEPASRTTPAVDEEPPGQAGRASAIPPSTARPADTIDTGGDAGGPPATATASPPGRHRHAHAKTPPLFAGACRAITTGPWPLAGILAVQAGLSLRLVWSNTAFGDEALYLWAGHLEWAHWLHGAPIPDFAAYFSGAPVVYPPLGALADNVGGLAGARILSLFFILGATCLLWGAASRLFSRTAAVCGCALFVALGPAADVGAFATYDAMAIFLLALAVRLALRARGRFSEAWLAGACLAMSLACAAKYASALWCPVVIALAVLGADGGWARGAARGARMLAYTAAVTGTALFALGGQAYVRGLLFTTLAREAEDSKVPAASIWHNSADWTGFLFLLAVAGTVHAFKSGHKSRWAALALTLAVVLAPWHQAQIHTMTSLYKHVVFGAWFGAIPAGYAMSRIARVNRAKAWRAAGAAVAFAAFAGLSQATAMYGFWPDSARLVTVVAADLPSRGLVLAPNGDAHVIDYYLRSRVRNGLLLSPDSAPAPVIGAMIHDRAFALVVADTPCKPDPGECGVLSAVKATGDYSLTSQVPWADHFGKGKFQVWVRSR